MPLFLEELYMFEFQNRNNEDENKIKPLASSSSLSIWQCLCLKKRSLMGMVNEVDVGRTNFPAKSRFAFSSSATTSGEEMIT